MALLVPGSPQGALSPLADASPATSLGGGSPSARDLGTAGVAFSLVSRVGVALGLAAAAVGGGGAYLLASGGGAQTGLSAHVSVHVAKALGPRGYNKVRVSLVRDSGECGPPSAGCKTAVDWAMATGIYEHPSWYPGLSPKSSFDDFQSLLAKYNHGGCRPPCGKNDVPAGFSTDPDNDTNAINWTYDAPFAYRWTDYHLKSALVDIVPGVVNTLSVDGIKIDVKIPEEDAGSIGMLIGDPCIVYDKSWCKFEHVFNVKSTMQTALNAMAAHDELDYWMMFGDLFYDNAGTITPQFFEGLSVNASSRVVGVTMGNHDYWISGSPNGASGSDSFGYGQMQYYAMDAVSAEANSAQPFTFDANPNKHQIVDVGNTFWYYKMGNVALIGFSNAYSWEENLPYFQEACAWANASNPALVMLLGHWNGVNDGCAAGMDTSDVFMKIRELDSCKSFGSRLKYVTGHKHCNYVLENNTGFLLGSFGFEDGDRSCEGAFGLPVLDTRFGWARLYYFELGQHGRATANSQAIMQCLQDEGYSSCLHYAAVWMEEPLQVVSRDVLAAVPMARPRCEFTLTIGSLGSRSHVKVTGKQGDVFRLEGCDKGRRVVANHWGRAMAHFGYCNETVGNVKILETRQICFGTQKAGVFQV
eukprot:TRINITY_DN995_c1_g1_i1.p1 TRINITY_DN995_c1_g1~~TRINITY_DN995_c1_g1_i1.p1  ORF type:complete len:667 (-),score=89.54 TRINITY_DN995_c1_g1_i1:470-2398(-)